MARAAKWSSSRGSLLRRLAVYADEEEFGLLARGEEGGSERLEGSEGKGLRGEDGLGGRDDLGRKEYVLGRSGSLVEFDRESASQNGPSVRLKRCE